MSTKQALALIQWTTAGARWTARRSTHRELTHGVYACHDPWCNIPESLTFRRQHRLHEMTKSDRRDRMQRASSSISQARGWCDCERIIAIPIGMSICDIALAHLAYHTALERGVGQTFRLA